MEFHIKGLSAKYLPAADANGKSDPYVKISLQKAGTTQKTKAIQNCLDPTWDEEFTIPVADPDGEVVILDIMDEDIACDDKLVSVSIPLSELTIGKAVSKSDKIKPKESKKGKRKHSPIFNYTFELNKAGEAPWQNVGSTKVLSLTVVSAKDFEKMDLNATDPYIVLQLNDEDPVKTTVKDNDMTPEWNEEFKFTIKNQDTDVIRLKLRDQDLKHDDDISTYEIQLKDVVVGAEYDDQYSFKAVGKIKKAGSVHLKYKLEEQASGEAKKKKKKHSHKHKSSKEDKPVEAAPAPAEEATPAPEADVEYNSLFCCMDVVEANGFGKKMNTFARVSFGTAKPQETDVVEKDSDPQYQKRFKLKIRDFDQGDVVVEIVQKKLVGEKVFGKVVIPHRHLQAGVPLDKWYQLDNKKHLGQVHLVFHITRDNDEPFVEKPFQLLRLGVDVIEAEDIPKADANATDAYIVARLSGTAKGQKTKVINNSMHPVWRQHFDYTITSKSDNILHIQLFDEDIMKDDFLSQYDLPIASIPLNEEKEEIVEMKPNKFDKGGKLHLKYKITAFGTVNHDDLTSNYSSQDISSHSDAKSLSSYSSSDHRARSLSPIHPHKRSDKPKDKDIGSDKLQVHVRLIEATNLTAKDLDGNSDPYCTIDINKQTAKSDVIKNTLNPSWNTEYHFDVKSVQDDVLEFKVFDHDFAGSDDLIGSLKVRINDLKAGKVVEQQFPLDAPKGKDSKVGELRLALHLAHVNREPFVEYSVEAFKLRATVVEAQDLPKMDIVGQSDGYVVLGLKGGKMDQKTNVIENEANPKWNQSFEFSLTSCETDVLVCQIYDDDDVSKDDMIGYVEVPLLKYKDMADSADEWFDLVPAKKRGGKLHLKLEILNA